MTAVSGPIPGQSPGHQHLGALGHPRTRATGVDPTVALERDPSPPPAPRPYGAESGTASAAGRELVIADRLPLRTPAQAAQLLAVPESWLRRKAAARTIPCTFLGKHLRFSPADLAAIATAGAQSISTRTPGVRRRHRAR